MSIIKPKRGTGSPAGSIIANEIAMDTTSRTLYTSTNGTDAVMIGNDTEYFLANNTISGITAETAAYSNISKFSRVGTQNFTTSSLEVERDLGSDGARVGKDIRGAGFTFTVKSDATNTNGAVQLIYPGAFYGMSGDGNNANPHWVGASTYDGPPNYAENTIFEGTKDELHLVPPVTATAGVSTEKLTVLKHPATSNAAMIITQDQYTPNSIELLADKSQANRKNQIWWNYDNAGTKEYIGQLEWQADGPNNVAGEHRFRIGSWNSSTNQNNTAIYWHRGNAAILSNGFYESNGDLSGYLRLAEDTATVEGLGLRVNNGRKPSTGALGPNSLAVTTDMSQDTGVGIMNSATFLLDYGSSAIPTSYTQNTMTFNVQNDAGELAGSDPVVGRIAAVQNADPLLNQMILRASNHGVTGGNADNGATQGGSATLTTYQLKSNVPVSLPQYTLTEANALTNVDDGSIIYVSNGNAGAKTLAAWDGSNWKVVALGATIS